MNRLDQIGDWLDDRVGWRDLVQHALEEPIPGGARWAYIFGSVLVGFIALQAITGWAMMAYYSPSATTAWASVEHLNYHVTAGWLVRGLHHFGAHAMIVVIGLHIAQVAIYGAYKAPREVNWWLGLGLLGITVGFGLTGYLLPWDQKGYWATRVATNIAGTMPLAGKQVQQILVGGPEYGSMTLTRFYTLHIEILPLLLLALLGAHLALFRRHGVTPPARADVTRIGKFYPAQLARDVGGVLLLLVIVFGLTLREHGAPLDAPADPASDYPARPEWYFLSLFQLLKYFPGPLEVVATLVVPGIAGAYLALLPIWDRQPNRALGPRFVYLAPLLGIGLGVVGLTLVSMRADAHDPPFQKARVLATERAQTAIALAGKGIPPDGPLAMIRRDPETRGATLFQENCANCHRLNDFGPTVDKAKAPDLTGWGTAEWAFSMMENPDAANRFANTPYKGEMILARPPGGRPIGEIVQAHAGGQSQGCRRLPRQRGGGGQRSASRRRRRQNHRGQVHRLPHVPWPDGRQFEHRPRALGVGEHRLGPRSNFEPGHQCDLPRRGHEPGAQGPHAPLRRQARARRHQRPGGLGPNESPRRNALIAFRLARDLLSVRSPRSPRRTKNTHQTTLSHCKTR